MLRCIGTVSVFVPRAPVTFDRTRIVRTNYRVRPVAERGRQPDDGNRARSRKGKSIENKKRRKGRPAWTRKPDDTPFRCEAKAWPVPTRVPPALCYAHARLNICMRCSQGWQQRQVGGAFD